MLHSAVQRPSTAAHLLTAQEISLDTANGSQHCRFYHAGGAMLHASALNQLAAVTHCTEALVQTLGVPA